MIHPLSLYNFGKSCMDSLMVGNVVRALCKQDVALTPAEQTLLAMIQNDNEWMDERIAENREKERKRQAEHRAAKAKTKEVESDVSRDVTVTIRDNTIVPVTKCDKGLVPVTNGKNAMSHTLPSFLPSSLPPSLQENTIRSVTVTPSAPVDNSNGNGNGTASINKLADAFMKAYYREGMEIFFAPEFDPVAIAVAVTGDARSQKRWRQLLKSMPESAYREELYAFFSEITAGEDCKNRGAALNARLSKAAETMREVQG